ncbi:DUF1294 domain-containing protein [Microbacterium aureliae]
MRPSPALARERDFTKPLPAALSWIALAAFAAALAVAYVALSLPWWMPAAYAALSILSFATYAADKAAAKRNRPRVAERTLLGLDLLGGWPGALVAQQVFRHKTRKRAYRRTFWARVVLNVLALGMLVVLHRAGVLPV